MLQDVLYLPTVYSLLQQASQMIRLQMNKARCGWQPSTEHRCLWTEAELSGAHRPQSVTEIQIEPCTAIGLKLRVWWHDDFQQ